MSRLNAYALMLLMSIAVTCAYFNTYYNAEKYFYAARKAAEKRTGGKATKEEFENYDRTIEKCKKVLTDYPESRYVDDALLLMGKAYYYIGDYSNSRTTLEELIREHPWEGNITEAQMWVGRAAWKLGQYRVAEEQITNALSETTNKELLASGYQMLSEISRENGDQEKELEFLKRVVDLSRDSSQRARAQFTIGKIYSDRGSYEEAVEAFQAVERYLPNEDLLKTSKMEYVRALKNLDKTSEALDVLQAMYDSKRFKSIKGEIELEFADLALRTGDIEGAIDGYGSTAIDYPGRRVAAEAWLVVGDIYLNPPQGYKLNRNYFYAAEYFDRAVKAVKQGQARQRAIKMREMVNSFLDADRAAKKSRAQIAWLSGRQDEAIAMAEEIALTEKEALDGILPAKKVKKSQKPDESTSPEVEKEGEGPDTTPDTTKKEFSEFGELTVVPADSELIIWQEMLEDKGLESADTTEKVVKVEEKDNSVIKFGSKERGIVIRELLENLYLVAEFYHFDFNLPDSARVIFTDILRRYPESEFAPRAALSLGILYADEYGEETISDSMFQLVLSNFPQSPASVEAGRRLELNLENPRSLLNIASTKYEDAFNLRTNGGRYEDILKLIEEIETNYPSSGYAAKAAYLRAVIYDDLNESPERSIEEYSRVSSVYPNTQYAKVAMKAAIRIRQATVEPDSTGEVEGKDENAIESRIGKKNGKKGKKEKEDY